MIAHNKTLQRQQRPRFPLGQVVATPGALRRIGKYGVNALDFISRHIRGDWGSVSPDDAYANECALNQGARIISCYLLKPGDRDSRIWIITEADRSSTCILTPEEY